MSPFKLYEIGKKVPAIKARIYLKDPLVAAARPNVGIKEVTVEGETSIGSGPTSSRVAVVDYNGDLDVLFDATACNEKGDAFKKPGKRNPLKNFYFHQIHVWAVIHKTLELLEAPEVFGRQIPWAFPGNRLLVLPHAGYWENAYYDRGTGALHFFYFESQSTGEPVYTCLSHDIVSHELGHAVLDGLKPCYNEFTSAQTAGFHEYFGDAIALTSALENPEIAVEVAGRGEGDLSAANLISNIAAEFGNGLSMEYQSLADSYLRNANNTKTMADMKDVFEEHDLSMVPTGVYYDVLKGVYEFLMKRQDRSKANKRVACLISAARVTRRMMLRALDYCPPVDIQYEDYARAVIRADFITYPIDSSGFRKIAVDAFHKRELGLGLERDPKKDLDIRNNQLRGLDIDVIAASKTDAYRFVDRNRAVFQIPPTANISVTNLYRTQKLGANDYRVPQEIVIEFVWQEEMVLRGKRFRALRGAYFPVWCGGTLVFDREGNLLHYTIKLNDSRRRRELEKYVVYMLDQGYLQFDDGEKGLGCVSGRGAKVLLSRRQNRIAAERCAAMRHFHSVESHNG